MENLKSKFHVIVLIINVHVLNETWSNSVAEDIFSLLIWVIKLMLSHETRDLA